MGGTAPRDTRQTAATASSAPYFESLIAEWRPFRGLHDDEAHARRAMTIVAGTCEPNIRTLEQRRVLVFKRLAQIGHGRVGLVANELCLGDRRGRWIELHNA